MTELEKKNRDQKLIAVYKELLTERQQEVLEDYYEDDFSLSEIAENRGTSKAAVYQNLTQALAKLSRYEEKLHVVAQKEAIAERLNSLEKSGADPIIIGEIKEIIDHGI